MRYGQVGVVRMRVMHETCCSNHGIFCITWGVKRMAMMLLALVFALSELVEEWVRSSDV